MKKISEKTKANIMFGLLYFVQAFSMIWFAIDGEFRTAIWCLIAVLGSRWWHITYNELADAKEEGDQVFFDYVKLMEAHSQIECKYAKEWVASMEKDTLIKNLTAENAELRKKLAVKRTPKKTTKLAN